MGVLLNGAVRGWAQAMTCDFSGELNPIVYPDRWHVVQHPGLLLPALRSPSTGLIGKTSPDDRTWVPARPMGTAIMVCSGSLRAGALAEAG